MNLRPFLLPVLVASMMPLSRAKAQNDEKLVEVRTIDQVYASYRDRRGTHGLLFGVNYENYFPDALISKVDSESYGAMFGDNPIPFMGIEIGYKYNFFLGSLAALYGYSTGTLTDSRIGEERSLQINRNSLKLMYVMDRLMAEPYAAPYVAAGIWDFGIDEKVGGGEGFSGQTKMGNSVTVGLLIQLNWIEQETSRNAYMSTGLENTYLDLFMTQHSNTSSEEDPTTRSPFDWGAGLRLEF
ncbi:MAG TPA: hypothetical protein PL182_00010 [Pseudobdellovibrionaceae bacterium]|nr:hypothetical protein [Pseudobdellovibrionaceae bacterium]